MVQFSLFAQGAFGESRTGAAGSDELPGKLDEVGRNLDGRLDRLKDGRLAEGDLFIERERLGRIGEVLGSLFNGLMSWSQ